MKCDTMTPVILSLWLLIIQSFDISTVNAVDKTSYVITLDNVDSHGVLYYDDPLTITIDSTTIPFDPTNDGKIKFVSSKDIAKVITDSSTVFDYNAGLFSFNWIEEPYKSQQVILFNWTGLYESLFGPPQGPSVETNLTVVDWNTTVPPFYVVLVNNENTKILALSKPFKVGRNDFTLTWKNTTVYPGEFLSIESIGFWRAYDYWKVYKITNATSLQSTPLAFNSNTSATLVHAGGSLFVVSWNEPGLYQYVFISQYGQVIIGISEPFRVLRRTNRTKIFVQTDKQSYNAGESITFTVQRQLGTTGWNLFKLLFYPANAPVYNPVNNIGPFDFNTFEQQQNPFVLATSVLVSGGQTRYDYHAQINNDIYLLGDYGVGVFNSSQRYKVAIYLSYDYSYLLGVTKPIRISNGISVKLPKRWLTKGETIPIQINNPYYNFVRGDYLFETRIVDADPTKGLNNSLIVTGPNLNVNFGPGFFKFAFYAILLRGNPVRFSFDITNSSFRVL